jgi:hypothetical protein
MSEQRKESRQARCLRIALHKARRYYRDQWYGHFTPSEIRALILDGAKPVPSSDWTVKSAREKYRSGESEQLCFYFYLGNTKPSHTLDIFERESKIE